MNSSQVFVQELTALLPTLRAFGRSLCKDIMFADDLVQETMLKAWNHRNRFHPGSNMKVWLLTILRHHYYSTLRPRKYEVEDPGDEHARRIAVQPEHEAAAELEELVRALMILPNRQREALLLVCADGLSYEQAANLCRCAIGTIRSRIARGRNQLMAALELNNTRFKEAKMHGFTALAAQSMDCRSE